MQLSLSDGCLVKQVETSAGAEGPLGEVDMQKSSSDVRPSRPLSRKLGWRQKSVCVEGPLGARGRLGRQEAWPEANLDVRRPVEAVLEAWQKTVQRPSWAPDLSRGQFGRQDACPAVLACPEANLGQDVTQSST